MSSSDGTSAGNRYIINIEEAAETARLMEQDRLFTQAMGGLFPERSDDISHVREILDIACGPGGWALEVAFQYPDTQVVGIDINPLVIQYAFAQARTQQLQNVTFEVVDALKPLPFSDGSFDLVNARLLVGFMDQESWPRLLAECYRILRPGGVIRLTECDGWTTNSPATQRLFGSLCQVLFLQKRTFSVDGLSFGLAHRLGKLIRDTGFEKVEKRAFFIDASCGADSHYAAYKDAEIVFSLLKPYIIKSDLVKEEEYDRLYNSMLADMLGDDFTSLSFGLITWGVKPS